MSDPSQAFRLSDVALQFAAGGDVLSFAADAEFWAHRSARPELSTGMLVSSFQSEPSDRNEPDIEGQWERHPAGDELVYVASGSADIVVYDDTSQHTITLESGMACVVPRGVWHRTFVRDAGVMVFITPGTALTEHRSFG